MNYISLLFQFSVLIPSAFLCYLPMRHQLRFPAWKILISLTLIMCALIPSCAALSGLLGSDPNYIMLPVMVIMFFLYNHTLHTSAAQNLAIFLLSAALMSFPADFSLAIDALIHPDGTMYSSCIVATGTQLLLSVIFILISGWFIYKYIGRLVDLISNPATWAAMIPIPVIFTLINIEIRPHYYATLYTNRIFEIYIFILIICLMLLIIFYASFYLIAMDMVRNSQERERMRLLEMQQLQYQKQQEYIKENSRLRHDFRQSIAVIRNLVQTANYDALNDYIKDYTDNIPHNDTTSYCGNICVNALLNYYSDLMSRNNIVRNWKIELPDNLSITDTELCGMLGNLLENVCNACTTVTDGPRYHNMSVSIMHGDELYIVSTNNFDGRTNFHDGSYHSTKPGAFAASQCGIGLASICTTAQKYGGTARFHNTANEFFTDIMFKI